jgi:hypothetical protein
MRLGDILRSALEHRRLPWILAGAAILISSPALFVGFCADDWFQLAVLHGFPWPEFRLGWWQVFALIPAGPGGTRALLDRGLLPWWLPADARCFFFRPLAALTHLADYRLFGLTAWVRHLENMLLYGALVVLAAILFRRIMGAGAAVGLAAALYALDDAHAFSVGWIAARNTMLAALFGISALLAHVAWRRDRWRPGAWLAPLCLLLGLLSGEAALGIIGYLFAYALFMEENRGKALRALAPHAGVLMAWAGVYAAGGFGMRGSGLYIDPIHRPAEFLAALCERLPLLLQAQWGIIPVELDLSAPPWMHAALVGFSVAIGVIVILLAAPLVRRNAEARFWALGSAAALVPIAATFPTGRLLFFAGLGAMALLARAAEQAGFLGLRAAQPLVSRALVTLFLIFNGIAGPLLFPLITAAPFVFGSALHAAERDAPSDALMPRDTLVLVNSPELTGGYVQLIRIARGGVVPGRVRLLAPAYRPLKVTREDERTLRLRLDGGWFFYRVERLIRGDIRGLRLGQRITLSGMQVEVTELTPDGRPTEVLARFDKTLEDAEYRWFSYRNGRLVPFQPPAIGASVTLPRGLPLPW